jgi:hypothetical protein
VIDRTLQNRPRLAVYGEGEMGSEGDACRRCSGKVRKGWPRALPVSTDLLLCPTLAKGGT